MEVTICLLEIFFFGCVEEDAHRMLPEEGIDWMYEMSCSLKQPGSV